MEKQCLRQWCKAGPKSGHRGSFLMIRTKHNGWLRFVFFFVLFFFTLIWQISLQAWMRSCDPTAIAQWFLHQKRTHKKKFEQSLSGHPNLSVCKLSFHLSTHLTKAHWNIYGLTKQTKTGREACERRDHRNDGVWRHSLILNSVGYRAQRKWVHPLRKVIF